MRRFTPSETVGYATLCAPAILVTVPNYSECCCVTLTQQNCSKPWLMRCSALLPKIHTIFEGTSEIQQLVIARAISGLRVE